ncbi:MAG: TetR/AcrR family transcriptional regulator [Candidatus Omnitrophica bacterium]|nr:TetR/AcrR family transcriptional regulator [Candidatus Omnitrophota bacterium]
MTTRRQEIVDAAKRIIASRGMAALTVRKLAQELKVTDGSLYRHFKSKKEIISLLIEDIETTLLMTIEAAAEQGRDPLGRLRAVLFSHISYAEQRKGLTLLLINEVVSLKDVQLQKKMRGVVEQYLKKIRAILEEGVTGKVFRKNLDVEHASLAFFGLVQSLIIFWSLSGFSFAITKKRVEALFDIYSEGIIRK